MKIPIIFLLFTLFFVATSNGQVVINEFQSSNSTTVVDDFGEFPDWIELYNNSDALVNLTGWSISDDTSNIAKWVMPELSIPAKSYLLFYASGRDIAVQPTFWNTIVDMGDEWNYIIPTNNITDWTSINYDDNSWLSGKSGIGYGDGDDSTIVATGTISVYLRKSFTLSDAQTILNAKLHVDYDDAFVAYLNGTEIARANIGTAGSVVNYSDFALGNHDAVMYLSGSPDEFDISNYTGLLQDGKNVLSIEVHNVSTTSSDLSIIPFLSLGKTSSTGYERTSAYLNLGNQNSHTNFKLSSAGEPLFIASPDGVIIDSIGSIISRVDISYGISPVSGEGVYFMQATPGYVNDDVGYALLSDDAISFSNNGGFISGSVSLGISSNYSTNIYFTTDGSEPDINSEKYSQELSISTTTTVRARVIEPGYLPGIIYSVSFVEGRKPDLPVVSLTTEDDYLWDYNIGMYAKGPNAQSGFPYFGSNFWNDWEYPFSFVFFNKQGNSVITQDIGAKIFGGWSRGQDQKSFSLFARKEYGKKNLDYSFFQNHNISSFSSLVIRNSGNDFSHTSIRDGLTTTLTAHLGIEHQAFQPVVAYLNGEYWGLYNLREKVNEDFLASHYNLDPDDVIILQNGGDVVEGTNTEFIELTNYLNSNTSLVSQEKYQYVTDKIDVDNFIKYQLTQIYVGNADWPGNNIKFWKTTDPKSKWRWILYDTDFGFGFYDGPYHNTLEFALATSAWNWANDPWATLMLRRMVTNIGFRNDFVNQMADNINTTFKESDVIQQIDSLTGIIDSEMGYHRTRWGMDYSGWTWEVEDVKDYARTRPTAMRGFVQNYFNLSAQHTLVLAVSDNSAGKIRVNTITPNTYPFNGVYFEDVPITVEAIPVVGYKFVRWEVDNTTTERVLTINLQDRTSLKAIFEPITEGDASLVINEINYNSGINYDSGDWLELYNPTDATLDISDFVLTELNSDSTFVMPEATTIRPGEFLVIAKSLKKFREVYPYVSNVIGDIPFGFSSTGDEIRLYDNNNKVLDAVDYLPYNPWPEEANGQGYSLELISPNLHNGLPENWKSINQGGTPGEANSGSSSNIEHETFAIENQVDVFPTKFTDYVTIQIEIANTSSDISINIVDVQGKIVHQVNEYGINGQYVYDWIPESNIQSGIYFVQTKNNNQIYNSKIIYQKQ